MRRRLVPLPCVCLVCLVAALAAGCGGSDGMVTRPTDEWVSGYCLGALDLLVFLVDTRDGTKNGNVTPKLAGDILTLRSGLFAEAMTKLGRPDTPDGDTGAATIRDLAAQEQARADRVAKSEGTAAERNQIVEDEANGGLKAITDTTAKLGKDDDAVRTAIAASSDCLELANDMRKHYSA